MVLLKMLIQTVKSEIVSHLSYIIGNKNEAAVIDPRRDCKVYVDIANKWGVKINCIFETHRNEDYVIGSAGLSEKTDAEVWHADSQMNYEYGNGVEDGQEWGAGGLRIKAIHSPGHTPGSMSYLLHDTDGNPWVLFSGDALFAGDVGRVDLLGMDRAEELAGMLYETIFGKFLTLGDEVLLCPAHGSGSVCGSKISERLWTTLGLERKYNLKLQYDSEKEFIEEIAVELDRPPYFRKMEELNLKGAPLPDGLPEPVPISPGELDKMESEETFILDTRSELGFGAAHVPGAQSIWLEGLPDFAGWFIPYDRDIVLVSESENTETAIRYLVRMGYDRIRGVLAGGMLSWNMSGKKTGSIETKSVDNFCRLLDEEGAMFILDVRKEEEIEEKGEIIGALNIPLTQLKDNLNNIPKDRQIHIFCGSGLRSMIAASYLGRKGWEKLAVILGGLAGWSSATCPLEIQS